MIRRGEPGENERVCGTWQFDEYPTYDEWISWFDLDVKRPDMMKLDKPQRAHLPVWCEGNVYLNGAKAWQHEKKNVTADGAKVELIEKDGQYTLKTNLYTLMQGFEANMIHSDVLGRAFEPDQRFENNDGSPITFDRDFFGSHRGIAPLPGPFANGIEDELFIWEDKYTAPLSQSASGKLPGGFFMGRQVFSKKCRK